MRHILPSQVVSLIEQMFPDATKQETNPQAPKFVLEPSAAWKVSAVIELIEAIPEHLLTIERQSYVLFVTSVKALKSWAINGGSGQNFFRIQGLSNDNPLTTLLKLLRQCPDEYPSPAISTLAFIDDDALRFNLCLDLNATEQAINNGEWKAATVLGGSVVEALLLWKLRKRPVDEIATAIATLKEASDAKGWRPHGQVECWDLWQYIKVARHLDLISHQGSTQAGLTKDFRNFIHPGKSLRTQQKCTRSTALTALAAAIRLIDEFSADSDMGHSGD